MKYLIIELIILLTSTLQVAADNNTPCQQPRYQAFDFWIGHWDVYADIEQSGPLLGTNQITKTQGGCLITEHWTSAKGTTGTSMNFYDGTQDKWVQHWVSEGGISISYSGGLVDDAMVLTGKISYAGKDEQPIREFKGTWTPLKEGAVRQHFEESTDGGKTWQPWFTGYYFKQN